MSSKSKKQPATVVPKPRYAIGQRVFIITDHRAIPENIFEAKVVARSAHEYKLSTIPGEKSETRITFGYELHSDSDLWRSRFGAVPESDLYPSYTEAAKVFAKAFLKPLK
jgi:hypothetical protein